MEACSTPVLLQGRKIEEQTFMVELLQLQEPDGPLVWEHLQVKETVHTVAHTEALANSSSWAFPSIHTRAQSAQTQCQSAGSWCPATTAVGQRPAEEPWTCTCTQVWGYQFTAGMKPAVNWTENFITLHYSHMTCQLVDFYFMSTTTPCLSSLY